MSFKVTYYIVLILFGFLLVTSCGSTKKVQVTNTPEEKYKNTDSVQETPMSFNDPVQKGVSLSDTVSAEIVRTKSQQGDTIVQSTIDENIVDPSSDNFIKNKIFFDHSVWNQLLKKHVTKEGMVNYRSFKNDKATLKRYLTSLSENMPDETWSMQDKLAYWMNAYNAFTIKLIIDNYPVKSIKDITDPWDARFFKLGRKWYNLNEIEHQILRKMGDPRIHFGINCASFSCPPLLNEAFTSENVYQQLENVTRSFINDPLRNNLSSDRIRLSKIFNWFAKDFKTKGTLIEFLNIYAKIQIHPNAKKLFLDYDWRLNEM